MAEAGAGMIDWFNLGANSLWVLGCALALGTLSWASWRASLFGEKLSTALSSIGAALSFSLAGLLICLGLFLIAHSLLERLLWAGLGAAFLSLSLRRQRRNSH